LLAAPGIGGGLGLGALALGNQPRRLGLGLGARVRHAAQLRFRRLALTRKVEAALLLDDARGGRFLGRLFALHALALGALQLVDELAHFLPFTAAALASAAGLGAGAAGAKSRLIMSPS